MMETLLNNADWHCFKTDFAGDLEDSKSTSGGTLCVFGSHQFVPVSWMCKQQTCVSHGSTESEIISLDADVRMDGIPALDLWDLIFEVLHAKSNQKHHSERARGDPLRNKASKKQLDSRTKTSFHQEDLGLFNVDFVSSNANSCHNGSLLYIFEDNEAVIKMIFKGRSLTMRHVSRTHRGALDWLFN